MRNGWKKKVGKRCELCGSEFELQFHHDRDHHRNRNDPEKDQHVILLCATCHFQEDFWKMMACYHDAMLKKYYVQCRTLKKELGVAGPKG